MAIADNRCEVILSIDSRLDCDERLRSITNKIHLAIRGTGTPIPSVPSYRIRDDGKRVFDNFKIHIIFDDSLVGIAKLQTLLASLNLLEVSKLKFLKVDYNLFDLIN